MALSVGDTAPNFTVKDTTDNYAQYISKGITVFGVSMDDESSHQAFAAKFDLPFPLLADTDGAIAKAYDVEGGGYAKRVTYVIGADGKISHVYTTVKTDTHATDVLTDIGA
jgi:thioredoxin-dependent peroxiredoxin